jgi:DNA-binding phage protein
MEKSGIYSKRTPKGSYAGKVQDYLETLEGKQDYLKVGVAEELWRAMERSGLSQAELARRAGVSPQYLTKVFKGTTNFTLDTLVSLFHHAGHQFNFSVKPLSGTPDHLVHFPPSSSGALTKPKAPSSARG